MSYTELKRAAFEANLELDRRKLVVYNFGNVSEIDRAKGVIAIKPSGVPYADLSPDDMVVVDLDNTVVEGKLKPSSDTRTHVATSSVDRLLDYVLNTPEDAMRSSLCVQQRCQLIERNLRLSSNLGRSRRR